MHPHHAREFSEYKKFIVSQFATFINVSQHQKFILLNHTICLHVAHTNYLFLNCFNHFSDLITHHIFIGVNQRILRWINWGLNTYPLVCPALQPAYTKISRKHISWAQLYLNWSSKFPVSVQLKFYTKYESCTLITISHSIGYAVVWDYNLFT